MRTWIAGLAVALLAIALPARADGAEIITWQTDSQFVDPSTVSGFNGPSELRVNVYLPDGYDPNSPDGYPVLFLLHGVGDAYNSWAGNGKIMEVAAGFDGIIVMPEADRGYYTNWWNGGRRGDPAWERYHLDELIPLVEDQLPIRPGRRWHAIYGFSMGGMGAMFYASQRPGYFGSAGASQGTLSLQRPQFQAEPAFRAFNEQDPEAIFGDPQAQEFYWAGHNPTKLVSNLAHTRLYVAVGDGVPAPDESPGPGQLAELEVRQQSEEFVAAARAAGLEVTYRPQQGTHDWPSRRRHLAYAIDEWGLFEPVDEAPTTWSYKTVAQFGDMWGFGFAFAAAPEQLITFSREGDLLLGSGSGSVEIVTPAGCRFVATLPFERALSDVCGPPAGAFGVPDTSPPNTIITKAPKKKRAKPNAKLKFVSDEPGSTFECQLKGKKAKKKLQQFAPCSSPAKYRKLKPGKYKFRVRAIDPTGNVDPTPAKKTFRRRPPVG